VSLKERKKIFLLGVISSYGANAVSIIVGLISVPIGLYYFGPVRYGIWAVISSLIAYLSFSNLGISTGATVLIGLQKVYWERFYFSLTSIAGLVALIFTVSVKGNLVSLALFRGLGILLVSIVCASHFLLSHKELLEKVKKPVGDEFSVSSIFSSSLRFFSLGIAAIVVWNTDNLVISHFLGVEAVTPYVITFKLLLVSYSLFSAIGSAGVSAGFSDCPCCAIISAAIFLAISVAMLTMYFCCSGLNLTGAFGFKFFPT